MSIASELSCDVATAMLSGRNEEARAGGGDLTSIVLEVYSTLRQMTEEARGRRRAQTLSVAPAPATPTETRAAGGH